MVFCLGSAVDFVELVWLMFHELDCDFLWKEYLAVVGGVACRVGFVCDAAVEPDFEVDVVGAPHVETGEDGAEGYGAIWWGDLNAAQKGQLVGGVIFWGWSMSSDGPG